MKPTLDQWFQQHVIDKGYRFYKKWLMTGTDGKRRWAYAWQHPKREDWMISRIPSIKTGWLHFKRDMPKEKENG